MPREGILFILVGPSGAGKNTLMTRVKKHLDNLEQLATMTTRAIREGEQHGREHRFVTLEAFQALIEENALIEYQKVHMDDYYGTPRQTVEDAVSADHDLIADIEFLGAGNIRDAYPQHTVLIFVTPSNLDILADRIQKRGDISAKVLANRLARARFEMTFAPQCDYVILNDDLELAAGQLHRIISSERFHRRGGDAVLPVPRNVFRTTVVALIRHEDRLLIRANAPDNPFPGFPMPDPRALPHDILRRGIKETLGHEISIEAISDSRFDFVAPNYVTIASNPPYIHLDFFYQCTLFPAHPAPIPGWEWRPPAGLGLPSAINALVTS